MARKKPINETLIELEKKAKKEIEKFDMKVEDNKEVLGRSFDQIDKMESIYKYRKRGFTYPAIAKILKVSEITVKRYYKRYIYLRGKVLKSQITSMDFVDIADHIRELEYLKELAYSNQMATKEGTMEHAYSLKLLMEIMKQIKDVKISTGVWGEKDNVGVSDGYEEVIIRMRKLQEEKILIESDTSIEMSARYDDESFLGKVRNGNFE